MLDKIGQNDDLSNQETHGKLAIDLNKLSAEIIEKCPLLATSDPHKRPGQSIEDIKLHLLYLINRCQSQSQNQVQRQTSDQDLNRPMSSARRLGSASAMGRKRPTSALSNNRMRFNMQDSRLSIGNETDGDLYSFVLNKEFPLELEVEEKLILDLDEHFDDLRSENNFIDDDEARIGSVDSYLDALYGNRDERLSALFKLQQLFSKESMLNELAEKRLLVCALVRSLADVNNQTTTINFDFDTMGIEYELILSCLLSLTKYRDIYQQAFEERNSIAGVDIIGAHLGSLAVFVGRLLQESKKDSKICSDSNYYLAIQHLILLQNLIQLDYSNLLKLYQPNELFLSLTGLLHLLTLQLSQDLRIMSKPEKTRRSCFLLVCLLSTIMKLSSCREFLCQIRGPKILIKNMKKNQKTQKSQQSNNNNINKQTEPFFDALINLVSRVQMSRVGSGSLKQQSVDQATIVTDKLLLNDFYELELLSFKLISFLIIDRRIRLKLIKRNILKSLLRNLVSLLASHNDLTLFNKSSVLLIPLDCLYKLTCEQSVLNELNKSRIILRCLFEYLLSSSSSVQRNLIEKLIINGNGSKSNANKIVMLSPMTEIKLEPTCADHYLLSIWCNLTSNADRLKILNSDVNLRALLNEYMQSVAKLVGLFCKPQKPISSEESRMIVYLHLKLIANLSRLPMDNNGIDDDNDDYEIIMEKLANSTILMIDQLEILSPLVIESLWTISNLLLRTNRPETTNLDNDKYNLQPCPDSLSKLMQRLFTFNQTDFETETDDDLLLVSCIFMAIIAQSREICQSIESKQNYAKIIRATSFLLTAKSSDKSILFASLFSLYQLTNHRECRSELASNIREMSQNDLLSRLANYMLHCEEDIANLACTLIDRFVTILSHTNASSTRFGTYNAKWLQTIRASRNELMTPPDEESAENFNDWLDEDRELLEDAAELSGSGGIMSDDIGKLNSAMSNKDMTIDDDFVDDCDVDEEDYDESGDDNISRLSSEAPDFSVVDPNSMIKHLVTRQQYRTQWAQQ